MHDKNPVLDAYGNAVKTKIELVIDQDRVTLMISVLQRKQKDIICTVEQPIHNDYVIIITEVMDLEESSTSNINKNINLITVKRDSVVV